MNPLNLTDEEFDAFDKERRKPESHSQAILAALGYIETGGKELASIAISLPDDHHLKKSLRFMVSKLNSLHNQGLRFSKVIDETSNPA